MRPSIGPFSSALAPVGKKGVSTASAAVRKLFLEIVRDLFLSVAMPSIKKRMTGFMRHLSLPVAPPPSSSAASSSSSPSSQGNRTAPPRSGPPPHFPPPRGKGKSGSARGSSQGSTQDSSGKEMDYRKGCFIHRYLSNREKHSPGPSILCGKTGHDLPVYSVSRLDPDVFAAYTGPEGGISSLCEATSGSTMDVLNGENEDSDFTDLDGLSIKDSSSKGDTATGDLSSKEASYSRSIVVNSVENDYPELCSDTLHWRIGISDDASSCKSTSSTTANQMVSRRLKLDLRSESETPVAGICNWYRPNSAATGTSISLYEKNPFNGENAGDPIADSFAILARKNSALLVLGDGVNWGSKAALASRCAVYGCIDYLNASLFPPENEAAVPKTTQVRQAHFLTKMSFLARCPICRRYSSAFFGPSTPLTP